MDCFHNGVSSARSILRLHHATDNVRDIGTYIPLQTKSVPGTLHEVRVLVNTIGIRLEQLHFTLRIKYSPRSLRDVRFLVETIGVTLEQLQGFVSQTFASKPSAMSMSIRQIVITLAGCEATFRKLASYIRSVNLEVSQTSVLGRIKRTTKRADAEMLVGRLQSYRMLLTMILTIPERPSSLEAEHAMNALSARFDHGFQGSPSPTQKRQDEEAISDEIDKGPNIALPDVSCIAMGQLVTDAVALENVLGSSRVYWKTSCVAGGNVSRVSDDSIREDSRARSKELCHEQHSL